jgi:hypothetical protein
MTTPAANPSAIAALSAVVILAQISLPLNLLASRLTDEPEIVADPDHTAL